MEFVPEKLARTLAERTLLVLFYFAFNLRRDSSSAEGGKSLFLETWVAHFDMITECRHGEAPTNERGTTSYHKGSNHGRTAF